MPGKPKSKMIESDMKDQGTSLSSTIDGDPINFQQTYAERHEQNMLPLLLSDQHFGPISKQFSNG